MVEKVDEACEAALRIAATLVLAMSAQTEIHDDSHAALRQRNVTCAADNREQYVGPQHGRLLALRLVGVVQRASPASLGKHKTHTYTHKAD